MLPSSNSARSSSSLSHQRPHSSLSHHTNRPGSSQSVASLARPLSSASVRPTSRASQRPRSRQQKLVSARLLPHCEQLVKGIIGRQAAGTEDEAWEAKYHELVDYSVKQLGLEGTSKAAVTFDMVGIEKMIRGHVEKARIKSRDTLADALVANFEQLKVQTESEHDLDAEIIKSRLPAHVQLLLALSTAPQPSTLTYASTYLDALNNPPPPPESAEWTWKKILEEEPFEGEHWVGVPGGIPIRRKRKDTNHDGDDDSLDDLDTSPSLSPLNSDDLALDDTSSDEGDLHLDPDEAPPPQIETPAATLGIAPLYTTHAYRKEIEHLKTKQYWKNDWKMDPAITMQHRGSFTIGDASTLGPTLQRVLPNNSPSTHSGFDHLPLELVLSAERYIQEQDAVREVLIALQGRNNVIFEWKDGQCMITQRTPRLLHLSLASQQSIFTTLAKFCTTAQRLRQFTSSIMHHSAIARSSAGTTLSALDRIRAGRVGRITRTLEAFADAVDTEIRALGAWCASREERWLQALGGIDPDSKDSGWHGSESGLVVSLLGTEKAFRDMFEDSFEVMLVVVVQVIGDSQSDGQWALPTRHPSTTTALLLDTLFNTVQQRFERGDRVTADVIMRVFVRTAEPVWGMVGKWIGTGFELNSQAQNGHDLEEEFFIESNGSGMEMGVLSLLDPDFWAEGYSLRGGSSTHSERGEDEEHDHVPKGIPTFLEHVAGLVLEAGKAMGLLKALGLDLQDRDGVKILRDWKWDSFQSTVSVSDGSAAMSEKELAGCDLLEQSTGRTRNLFSVSVDQLSRLTYDKLAPYCQSAGALLADSVIEECDFWPHLRAIESLYLMRRGDVINDFADLLFGKIDARQNWSDFHFLNTAFSDVIEASNNINKSERLQTSLVRLSYRGPRIKERSVLRTVKAFDSLCLEYSIPFPLTYIFTPRNLQIYGDIFVFLLQIRRAKNVLEKILVRSETRGDQSKAGLKAFYAMRSRLSWFINTLLNFLTTYVIHVQVLGFHKALEDDTSQSFDKMIQLHDEHLKKIQSRCFLQIKTAALYRAVLSILDMSLTFCDVFVAFAGDTTMTHDISNRTITIKHHRSRRQRRRRKNVIGFSQSMDLSPDSSDSDADIDDLLDVSEADYSRYEGSSSYSVNMGASVTESEDFFTRINKMSSELDGLVRFVRRGVETLAGGTGDAAATFGVLAFALEDWDL